MLTGRGAKDANIQYLEYEARNVIANGNLWKTYGSPVRTSSCFTLDTTLAESSF